MPIRVTCPACQESLKVSDELAGKRVRCLCGATLRVTSPSSDSSLSVGQKRRLLVEATLAEILGELNRRGLHGLLSLIDLREFGAGSLGDFIDLGEQLTHAFECHATESLGEEQHERLLELVAEGLRRLADPTTAAEGDSYYEPFALKGDPLGMTLAEFKQKHHRVIPGSSQTAPFCSDMAAGFRVNELHTESWHSSAGIVHARLDYPAENHSPVIAGIQTDLLLYQFLDGRLYQIVGLFGTEDYPEMAELLRNRNGAPSEELQNPMGLVWRRLHSTMQLTKGRIHPRSPARLRLFLDEMLDEVARRERAHGSDI